jgi:hypothetical protein
LAPGQKVQPKRSIRISPGGFRAALQLDVERSGTSSDLEEAQVLDKVQGPPSPS